jgi:predicted secreted protein
MRRRAAIAGAVLAATAVAAPDVVAGDYAALQPIGFSSDGNVFAFEEYGVEDGSGFPYSTIYVLDTRTDSFLPGAPVRAVVEEDGGGLHQARSDARRRAAPLIDAHRLAETPGILAAYNPITEAGAAPHALRYDAFPTDAPFRKTFALKLEEKSFEPEGICKNFLKEVKGFRLTMTEKANKPAADVLQDDMRIPQSRRCPMGYRIGGVITRINDDGSEVHVVMILVESLGFEGSRDGRWIAVPVRIRG